MCCTAAALLDCLFSPLIIPRWASGSSGSSTVVWHLDMMYIYIYPWLEGRAGATQIRFCSQAGTWAAVVLLTAWAQQLQKMFSLSISYWLIKVGLHANQKVLIKFCIEASDPRLSHSYTEEHMDEDELFSGPMWPTESGVTWGKFERKRKYTVDRAGVNHFLSTSGLFNGNLSTNSLRWSERMICEAVAAGYEYTKSDSRRILQVCCVVLTVQAV